MTARRWLGKWRNWQGRLLPTRGCPAWLTCFGGIVVEKDGTIALEGETRMDLLEALIAEGLVGKEEAAEEETESGADEETSAEAETENEAEEMPADAESESETEEETPAEAAPVNEEAAEERPAEAEERPEEEGNEQDSEESAEETQAGNTEQVKPAVSFPLSGHRADSLINLVYTIFSRGRLLSKATGGEFSASQELVDTLSPARGHATLPDTLNLIHRTGGLKGLSFEEDKVIFDGFPATADQDVIKAWTELSAAVNRSAIKQNHVRAKEADETNEKFAFRTWLTRLGMNGPDMKKERNILYRNLSGHTAFRTPADEEKWKARQAEKRAELKAAKDEESRENGAEE